MVIFWWLLWAALNEKELGYGGDSSGKEADESQMD